MLTFFFYVIRSNMVLSSEVVVHNAFGLYAE